MTKKLTNLLANDEINKYVIETKGELDIDIINLRNDSRLVEVGSLFIAIKGVNHDGINYVKQAKRNGAVALVVEENINLNTLEYLNLPIVKVKEVRRFLAYLSKYFYNDPTSQIPVIAITGSKGKTTTTFILTQILMKSGYNVGTIGTVGAFLNLKEFVEIGNTTAEAFQTNEIIYNMILNGADIIVLEVSSQAIVQDRVEGMNFKYSTFTNFSHDHISPTEHPTEEAYYNAKIQIANIAPIVILNMDDKNVIKAKEILKNKKIISYGYDKDNDIIIDFKNIHYTEKGTEFTLEYNGKIRRFKTTMLR